MYHLEKLKKKLENDPLSLSEQKWLITNLETERENFTLLERFIDIHLNDEAGRSIYSQFHNTRGGVE